MNITISTLHEDQQMTIHERIAEFQSRLTPTERKIASVVSSDPTLLAFGTVSDLADHIETSRPSIVRFAQKLGCDGFPELQQIARDGLSTTLTRPSDRVRASGARQPNDLESVSVTAETVAELSTSGQIGVVAEALQAARAVWIISGETSQAGARVLMSGLSMLLSRVTFPEQHRIGQDLASATDEDIAVIVDFYRYRKASILGAQMCSDIGMPLIAITDGPLSPLAGLAQHLCVLSVPAVGPFDSALPAVATAELIVAEVARLGHDEAQLRIDRTEDLWRQGEIFAPDP